MKSKLGNGIALAALAVSLWLFMSGCYADSTTTSGTTTGMTAQPTGTTSTPPPEATPPPATPAATDTAATPARPDTSGQHR